MSKSSNKKGRGSNLTTEARRKGGQHSHQGSSSEENKNQQQGRGSNLNYEDRRKGGER